MSTIPFVDVLDKANNGPICEIRDWDINVISKKVKEKLIEHGLRGSFDRENPINTDNGLADEFWKAGFELAVETGMLCTTTRRVIKFTERELKDYLGNCPDEITRGRDLEQRTIRNRRPEDRKTMFTWIGPFTNPVSEDLFVPITQSAIQYKAVDAVMPPTLITVYGRPLKSGTPYETLAGKLEALLQREAARRAQRPGIPIWGGATSPSEYGTFGGYGVPGGADPATELNGVLPISELKTDYSLLQKVAHFLNCGSYCHSGYVGMVGGYAGPPEGAALVCVAAAVLQLPVHQAKTLESNPFDLRYVGNCGREAVWSGSIARQAVSRNTHILLCGLLNPVGWPGTDMLLQEAAVESINSAVSGCALVVGVRAAGGGQLNAVSGLESKFAAEVCKSSCGLSRADGNEMVKNLIGKYEGQLMNPPRGKTFTECFDVKTLNPTKEWLNIYEATWKNLEDLGIPRKD